MGERTFDCIKERPRFPFDGDEVWHIARTRGRTQDFVPIRCSKDEGITLPGPIERRVPTCPTCIHNGGSG